jgi:hypothetical protein
MQPLWGRKGMTKPTVIGANYAVPNGETFGHAPGKWIGDLRSAALNDERTTENGESYPQLDCIELERFIFPVLHVTRRDAAAVRWL